jgi:peptidoglycan hydrolase CwlO-like protein
MNAQFILLTQSVTGAVVEIILLLVGAALIGFVTAWFYQKSYFTPIIKKLEAEKEELNRKIAELNTKIDGLNADISSLKSKISDLEKTIASKDREIEELKKPKK